jgi:hypothetical protein
LIANASEPAKYPWPYGETPLFTEAGTDNKKKPCCRRGFIHAQQQGFVCSIHPIIQLLVV